MDDICIITPNYYGDDKNNGNPFKGIAARHTTVDELVYSSHDLLNQNTIIASGIVSRDGHIGVHLLNNTTESNRMTLRHFVYHSSLVKAGALTAKNSVAVYEFYDDRRIEIFKPEIQTVCCHALDS